MRADLNERQRDLLIKHVIELSYQFMDIRDANGSAPITNDELWFVLPSVKKSLSLYSATSADIKEQRLLSATIISRTLIEVIVTLLYITGLQKTDGFYDKFMEHGRVRIKRNGKGWEKVTITSQIRWVEENYRITQLEDIYNNCSKLVHFSDKAVQLIIDRSKSFKDGERTMAIVISDNEKHFEKQYFDRIHETADGMMLVLKAFLTEAVKHRKLTIKSSELLDPN
jgi:hypothetical protein